MCFQGSWQYIQHLCVNSRKVPCPPADTILTHPGTKVQDLVGEAWLIIPLCVPPHGWPWKVDKMYNLITVALCIKKEILNWFQYPSAQSLYESWSQDTPVEE